MRPFVKGLMPLLVIAVVGVVPAPAVAQGSDGSALTVLVTTDQSNYETGELVTLTVRVLRDGHPVSARIHRAILTKYDARGHGRQRWITRHFHQSQTGVFVAQAKAGRPGLRQVYVQVQTFFHSRCGGCAGILKAGTASYVVQPLPSKLITCKPDFVVKHVVDVPGFNVDPPVTWALPSYVTASLQRRADTVTFELAPGGTVIWSAALPFGFINDDLSELERSNLSFDPRTGAIEGNLDFRDVEKRRYHFYIRALNREGVVIAGIWVQIVFR